MNATQQSIVIGLVAGTVLLLPALRALAGPAQTTNDSPVARSRPVAQNNAASAAPTTNTLEKGTAESTTLGALTHSSGVDEILKMARAGVTSEVIKLFIENSPIPYDLSAADIIALKEQAVSDELTTAMIKRGAALKARESNHRPVPARGSVQALDPESYEFFQYYYLLPRTVAAANQRLFLSDPYYHFGRPYPLRPIPAPGFIRP